MTAATRAITSERPVLLTDISWETYERLLKDIGDRPIRLTYDRGDLEIMSPSQRHERVKKILGRLLEAYALHFDVPIRSGGSTTHRKRRLKKGLEPDECYYIRHEAQLRNKSELDFNVDPPPDLVIEVELSRRLVDRLAIYADLGVPEVWRFDGKVVHVLLLDRAKSYVEHDSSLNLPELPMKEVNRALSQMHTLSENDLVRVFLKRVGRRQSK